MCYTYDKSKGGDTRELQSRMVPPKKTGSSHLKRILTNLFVWNIAERAPTEVKKKKINQK